MICALAAFAATATATATASLCEYDILRYPRDDRPARRALVEEGRLWRGGVVPYVFTQDVSNGLRGKVTKVMGELEAMAQVSFVDSLRESKRPAGGRLVVSTRHVENPSGCWATVGMPPNGGVAKMNLGWCRDERHITHELLHVLGMWHEQSRQDSDKFLRLKRDDGVNDCIIRGTDSRGFSYDFRSIMHYPLSTIDAELTAEGIERLRLQNARPDQVGRWGEASEGDIRQLAAMYGRGEGRITHERENTTVAAGIIVAAIVLAVIGLYWGMRAL